MIVQCTSCRSRFRVADERVPDKGVKVRCTKCSTVFRVTRADAVDGKPSTPAPQETAAPLAEPTVALPGAEGMTPHPEAPPPGRSSPVVPPAASLTYGAASPNLSLDFDLGPPPSSPPPRQPTPTPARQAPPANPIMNAIDAALDAAMTSDDPFGTNEPAHPYSGLPSLPPPGSLTPPREETPPPQGPSSIDLFGDTRAADRLAAAALELDYPPAPPPAPAPAAPAAYDSFFNLASPRSAPPASGLAIPQPPREETDPFAGLDAPAVGMAPAPSYSDQAAPRESTRSPVREPTQPPPAASEPGFVPSSAREIDLPEPTQQQRLDLASEAVEPKVEFARIAPLKVSGPIPMPDLRNLSAKVLDPKAATKARLRREFASAVLNVASAALVCYAGIVAIAVVRTPRPVGYQDLGFPMVWLAFGAESPGHTDSVRALNVHTGVYQTNTGEEMFYLQGQIQNDSSRRHEAMYVTLELRRGNKVLDHTDAIVGLHADPEDLYDLVSRKNEDLQSLLSKRASATALEPHKAASFVGIFDVNAKDLAGTDISIAVHDGFPASLRGALSPKKADAANAPAPAEPTPVTNGTGKPVETARTP
jgi:predicted Zn finger-like uncharacterized protein